MPRKKCFSCLSSTGKIFTGKYWKVDHAFSVGLLGWLVIVPKRHVTALHNLTAAEWREFGEIHRRVVFALHKVLKTDKEYSACFAEQAGFSHIHFHIIPRAKALPKKFRGSKVFQLMNPKVAPPVATKKIIAICKKLSKALV